MNVWIFSRLLKDLLLFPGTVMYYGTKAEATFGQVDYVI